MSFAEYLQLVEWTGRQTRADKHGTIPNEMTPIFERLALNDEAWLKLVHDFRNKFRRAAGRPESLLSEAQKHGCRKMPGMPHSREIFDPVPPPGSTA